MNFDENILERLGNIDFAKFNIGYIGKNDQAP
jgi:hypothetical protein